MQPNKTLVFSDAKSELSLEIESMSENLQLEILPEVQQTGYDSNLFLIQTANDCINQVKGITRNKRLFDEFFIENEVCILFADTGVGKSILATQIGQSISSGVPIDNFQLEVGSQKVFYLDFELSAKQFEKRYAVEKDGSDLLTNHYTFSDNFFRLSVNPDSDMPTDVSFDKYVLSELEKAIVVQKPNVIIVDNITYLKDEQEKSSKALELMKQLKHLKTKHNLSVLVLAHTPKVDNTRPIHLNSLSGSKALSNFADSIFTIGASTIDSSLRYLKQIKVRDSAHKFTEDNVAVCCLQKEHNYLQFVFSKCDFETNHLKVIDKAIRLERKDRALELNRQGLSNVAIGSKLGVTEGAVRKWLKQAS
tara:strand:- start:23879 stop:24970 length:1092 start_codon:yes stop_codon:yes gene_type:complete